MRASLHTLSGPLLLAAAVAAIHAPIILGTARFPSDYEIYHYPLLLYAFRELKSGGFPFWDAGVYSGMPFAANPQTALFYPPHLLLFGFSLLWDGELTQYRTQFLNLFHFYLAAIGMWLLLEDLGQRRVYALLGAVLFVMSGFLLSQSQHLGLIEMIAWMPLAFLLVRRLVLRAASFYAPILALVLAQLLLVGFMPAALVFLFILAAYAAFLLGRADRVVSRVAWLGGALVLAAGIAAVTVVPTLESLPFAPRLDLAAGVPISSVLTAIVPDFLNHRKPYRYWGFTDITMSYFYAGTLVLALLPLGLARRDRELTFFKLLLVASFLAGFSPTAEIVLAPLQALPVVGPAFRPVNFLVFLPLAAVVLAIGALADLRSPSTLRRSFALWLVVALLLIPLAHVAFDRDVTKRVVVAVALLAAGVLATFAGSARWKQCVIVAGLIELFLVNRARPFYAWPGDPEGFYAMRPDAGDRDLRETVSLLRQDRDLFRVSADQDRLGAMWWDGYRVWELEGIGGFEPQRNPRYFDYLVAHGARWHTDRLTALRDPRSPAFRLLNVKYHVTSDPERMNDADFELVKSEGFHKVYRYRRFAPRYLVLPPGTAERIDGDYRLTDFPDAATPAEVRSYDTNERVLRARAESDGAVLFIGEVFHPGWTVSIDGRETTPLTVNGFLMAVPLPRGESEVRLVFRPRTFVVSAVISAIALLMTVTLGFLGVARSRRMQSLGQPA